MKRRFLLPLSAALAITLISLLLVSTTALAQGPTPLERLRRLRPLVGQITALESGEFTIEKQDGAQQAFRVDEKTRYFTREKEEISFDDLATGRYAAVVPQRPAGGSSNLPLARLVVLLPEDFNPENFEGLKGRVTTVDLAGSAFTLETKDEVQAKVDVDGETVFRGQVEELADLQAGMLAGVILKEAEGGEQVARVVRAGYPPQRFAGKIASIDGDLLTVDTRRGETVEVLLTDATRFPGGMEPGDLQPGMGLIVTAVPNAGGQLEARLILARPKPQPQPQGGTMSL